MKELKNKTVLSKQDIREINGHIYLKTPLYVVLYVVCVLSVIVRLIDYFVYNQVNLSATIPFLLALVAMFLVFVANTKNMYNQSLDENGNATEYDYTVTETGVRLETSDGKSAFMDFKMLYKSFETKNCFALRGRDNSFFIIKKNGFLDATPEEFREILKGR